VEQPKPTALRGAPETPAGTPARQRLSMHEGIASWCDCCSCEAEPYWAAVAAELGIDLGSDYEDAGTG
jgi:hypothetical protein